MSIAWCKQVYCRDLDADISFGAPLHTGCILFSSFGYFGNRDGEKEVEMTPIDKDDYEDIPVFDQLVELISKMTDAEQEKLLEALQKRKPTEEREQRISLYTETTFNVGGEDYKGIVLDMSAGGCFIETQDDFATGQEISIRMRRSKDAKTVIVRGRIARIEPNGVGVQFYK
jgi:hypothetical protein